MKRFSLIFVILIAMFFVSNYEAYAAVLFYDDFNSGARPEWGSEIGAWETSDGLYYATTRPDYPYSSVTSLPELTDFVVELDINNFSDGGVWLRSTSPHNAVLLVTGGNGGSYNGMYWHIMDNGTDSSSINFGEFPGIQGTDAHVRIEVIGDTYSAYLNNATTPLTTLVTDRFSSGRVALLNSNFGERFDSISISDFSPSPVPEPSTIFLLGTGLVGLLRFKKRRK
jgi:hypothetical protein